MYFSFHFHIKPHSLAFFLQYSQAHRSSSFHKYFLSVVSYKAKYYLHVIGNLLAPWFNVYTLYSCA